MLCIDIRERASEKIRNFDIGERSERKRLRILVLKVCELKNSRFLMELDVHVRTHPWKPHTSSRENIVDFWI